MISPRSPSELLPWAISRERVSILSPLRYPGSKRRLAAYIAKSLEINGLSPELFIEPFAGGASVALQLLKDGHVASIGLADADPLVASFWKAVFLDTDWLVNEIETIDVSMEMWDRFKKSRPFETRDRALACLFLNRTSFSGIISASAGPIGGRRGNSSYEIGCRFPRKTLVRRIREAAGLREHVRFVWNGTWRSTMSRVRTMRSRSALPKEIFYYFDPPFIEKASRLYNRWFRDAEHGIFRDYVTTISDPWLISYDSAPRVAELYANVDPRAARVEVLYTSAAKANGGRRASEAIVTNLPHVPKELRLWRRTAEWRRNSRDGGLADAAAS